MWCDVARPATPAVRTAHPRPRYSSAPTAVTTALQYGHQAGGGGRYPRYGIGWRAGYRSDNVLPAQWASALPTNRCVAPAAPPDVPVAPETEPGGTRACRPAWRESRR